MKRAHIIPMQDSYECDAFARGNWSLLNKSGLKKVAKRSYNKRSGQGVELAIKKIKGINSCIYKYIIKMEA
jgi:hypothetical protein